jgi:SNF2 family DNA or RNA helicase
MENTLRDFARLTMDEERTSTFSSGPNAHNSDVHDVRRFKYVTERVIESIQARRVSSNSAQTQLSSDSSSDTQSFEYLVKYQALSHIHNLWLPEAKLKEDSRTSILLQKFLKRIATPEALEEPQSNLSLTEVERIIAHYLSTDGQRYFLVKWKHQNHSSCTWEHENDIHDLKYILEYNLRNAEPPESYWAATVPRPDPSEFKPLDLINYKNKMSLRDFQREGVNWLRFCWYNRQSCILADEMGLGKTIQTICLLDSLVKNEKLRGPFLIVAPIATIQSWGREFELWTDLHVLVYMGDERSRQILRHFEFFHAKEPGTLNFERPKFQVLITSFEMLIKDAALLSGFSWNYAVIDEAHRLKNSESVIVTKFKTFKYERLLLLTGTPLLNTVAQLWVLLNLLDGDRFPSLADFTSKYGNLTTAQGVGELHSLLRPLLLRRLKSDAVLAPPPAHRTREDVIIQAVLTQMQQKYYDAILEKHAKVLQDQSPIPSLLSAILELRKCCNHPYLLQGVEETETKGLDSQQIKAKLRDASGKTMGLSFLLADMKRRNLKKLVIVSQMVRVLDLLEDFLRLDGIQSWRIDGSTSMAARLDVIDSFSRSDSGLDVLLLSSRSGTISMKPERVDAIIVYDADWYSEHDIIDGICHPTAEPLIYRILMRDPYECELFRPSPPKHLSSQ